MKILILEDNAARIKQFSKNLHEHDCTFVQTPNLTIKLLDKQTWDWLFLDHDLGGQVMVTPGDNTGYRVACWLEEHPDRKPVHIILHSMNPAGIAAMQNALPDAKQIVAAWVYNLDELIRGDEKIAPVV